MREKYTLGILLLLIIVTVIILNGDTQPWKLHVYTPNVLYESRELLHRKRWEWFSIQDGSRTFYLPQKSHLIKGERAVMQLLQTLVCKNYDIVVDVGANIGHITLLLAARNCTTVAFELQIACIDMLRASLRLNQMHADILRRPISDKVGQVIRLARETECNGMYSTKWRGTEELTTTTLDAMFPEPTRIKLLKIDIEGHELHALMGAVNLFSSRRVEMSIVESTWWPNYWNATGLKWAYNWLANLVYDNSYHIECIGSSVGGSIAGMRYDSKLAFLENYSFWINAKIVMTDGSSQRVIYCSEFTIS